MYSNVTSVIDNIIYLDLKTNGLEPENSNITEIGIVKIKNKKIETFTFNLKEMHINFIKKEILNFLEDFTIIVHDVKLKEKFLKYYIKNIRNKIIDSLELAMILEPYHKEYSIKYLKETLAISYEKNLSEIIKNCIDNMNIVNSLILRLDEKGKSQLEPLTFKVNSMLSRFNLPKWEWSFYIDNLSHEVDYNDFKYVKYNQNKQNKSQIIKDRNLLKEVFATKNKYEDLLKNGDLWVKKEGFIYEFRQGQYELTKTIREVFNKVNSQAKIAMIEAPTGIGKSVGYLLPAMIESYLNKKRIVISTDTKELQTQLINKDIPNVLNSLGLDGKVSYGYIKGKNNYICVDKLESYIQDFKNERVDKNDVLSLIYLQMLVEGGLYGDIEEISYSVIKQIEGIEFHIHNVCCDPNVCRPKNCIKDCLYKNRVEELKKEDITVINHSLLAKWPYKDEKPIEHLIVDEAHNLVEKGYEFFSGIVDSRSLMYMLQEMYPYEYLSNSHFYYNIYKNKVKRSKVFDKFYYKIGLSKDMKEKISQNINFIVEDIKDILDFGENNEYRNLSKYNLRWELNLQEDEVVGYSKNIDEEIITYKPYSQQIKLRVENIIRNLVSIIIQIENLIDDDNIDKEDESFKQGKSRLKDIEEVKEIFKIFLEYSEEDQFARIVDIEKDFKYFEIRVVPLNLADLFEENILSTISTGIFLSATLSVQNNMNYFKNSLGINRVENIENVIEPLYDYKNNVCVISTSDICSYKNDKFAEEISKFISDLSSITDGKMLSLFTSNERLEKTYEISKPQVYKNNIEIYKNKQGIKYLKDRMRKSIVLGSKGCFEGVDIPGDGLICVTLDKIPNLNPKDPLYSTIMKKYNKTYGSLNYPQMAIKVKQALGRLLRSKYDYGCFVIFNVGSNMKTLSQLERDIHGCKIYNVNSANAKSYVEKHIKMCRNKILQQTIKEILNKKESLKNNTDITNYINNEMQSRSLEINTYGYDSNDGTFKARYYNLNFLIDKNIIQK